MTSPGTHPDLYRSIVLGSHVSPGTVTLSGHDREWDWQVNEAKASVGATSVLNGSSVGQFQASFFLASVADQIAWSAFQRVLESTVTGPTPKALPVYHPDLAANGFAEVCVAHIGGALRDTQGGMTVQVKFIEHRPATPKPSAQATGGGGGSGGTSGAGGNPDKDSYDPNAERKKELEALLAEVSEA